MGRESGHNYHMRHIDHFYIIKEGRTYEEKKRWRKARDKKEEVIRIE